MLSLISQRSTGDLASENSLAKLNIREAILVYEAGQFFAEESEFHSSAGLALI